MSRDLKIGRRDELGRLPEVNLHNWACARELLLRVFAVLVSSRTPFREFCRRVENVSIFIFFLTCKTCHSIPISYITMGMLNDMIFFVFVM